VDLKKLVLLMLFAILITGIVVYESKYTRHQASGSPSAKGNVPVSTPSAIPQSAAVPVVPVESGSQVPQPVAPLVALSIPKRGWGRNPFLTVEEIAQLRNPVKPVEPVPVEAPAVVLPPYAVSAIVINNKGKWAVIDSRVLRVGDRIGIETVTEITSGSIVLESGGKTRKLLLGTGPAGQGELPKG
jgi:hypothetical protein